MPRTEVLAKLHEANGTAAYSMIIVGSGTSSKPLIAEIRAEMPSMAILVVDERDTSLQARERYWEHHRRRGWQRLIPSTLVPINEPIDDFAALILAERVLNA